MHELMVEKAASLAQKMGYVFLATADAGGVPHMSVVQPLGLDAIGRVKLIGWFCQYTTANLEVNGHVSIIIWDAKEDTGFQLIGELEEMVEVAFMDGYAANIEKAHPMPSVERRIHIKIDKILGFEKKPHIDM